MQSVAQRERRRVDLAPEGDLEAAEEVALAEETATFGCKRWAQLELMTDVAPLTADEHFDIPDLTDEEWEAFVAALDE
jgi:hypothetical protein